MIGFRKYILGKPTCLFRVQLGLVLILLLSSLPLQGQSLDDYLQIAAENNPALKASYATYEASLERISQEGALPNPELSFGIYLQDMATLMGDQKMNASIMQRFPWFGSLQASKDQASLMAQAKFQEFEMTKYALFFDVKKSYYKVFMLHHHQMIAGKNVQLLKILERLALNKFKGGEPSKGRMADVLRVQSNVKEMEALIIQLEDDVKLEKVRFNSILNCAEETPVHLDSTFLENELLLNKELVLDSILHASPQMKKLEVEGLAYQKQGEVAQKAGMPSFGLGLSYMVNSPRLPSGDVSSATGYRPGGMGHNMVMPMVSVSLPIYRKQYAAAKRESEKYREVTAYEKEDLYNSLKLKSDELFNEIHKAERNKKLYHDQVSLLERSLELLLTEYSSSEGSFEDVITVQRQLLEFEMKVAEESVRKLTAIAELEMLMSRRL
ncbi:TolC family protein [Echinicola sp. 20G]|uniref:TolC family protein n=1 Tax=Echinicola sp. 20G TaxID=2781961 RepID=UPI001910546A|nr:TolC family protein [Echinicola sp. 20G]